MKPDRFADLIAILRSIAPARSTAGWLTSTSTSSTAGRSRSYHHPVMKDVLEETYGVMVYQEQVMRILNRLGGIELSQAYACIKAISKKKVEIIAQGRKQFIDGAVERGLDKDKAEEDLRPDRVLRRLRLQQVAHRGLRPGAYQTA